MSDEDVMFGNGVLAAEGEEADCCWGGSCCGAACVLLPTGKDADNIEVVVIPPDGGGADCCFAPFFPLEFAVEVLLLLLAFSEPGILSRG